MRNFDFPIELTIQSVFFRRAYSHLLFHVKSPLNLFSPKNHNKLFHVASSRDLTFLRRSLLIIDNKSMHSVNRHYIEWNIFFLKTKEAIVGCTCQWNKLIELKSGGGGSGNTFAQTVNNWVGSKLIACKSKRGREYAHSHLRE